MQLTSALTPGCSYYLPPWAASKPHTEPGISDVRLSCPCPVLYLTVSVVISSHNSPLAARTSVETNCLSIHNILLQTQRNIGAADFTPSAGPGSSAAGRTPVPADFTGQESSTEGQEGSPGVGTANPSSGTRNRLDPQFINGKREVCVFCLSFYAFLYPLLLCI